MLPYGFGVDTGAPNSEADGAPTGRAPNPPERDTGAVTGGSGAATGAGAGAGVTVRVGVLLTGALMTIPALLLRSAAYRLTIALLYLSRVLVSPLASKTDNKAAFPPSSMAFRYSGDQSSSVSERTNEM